MTWENIIKKPAKDYETGRPLVEGPRTKEEQEYAELGKKPFVEQFDFLEEQSKRRAEIDSEIYTKASVLIQMFKPISKELREISENNYEMKNFLRSFRSLIEKVLERIEDSIKQETDFVDNWSQLGFARTNQFYRDLRSEYGEIKEDLPDSLG
mgnify:CR=1 FL=1|tara:strand:- start:2366 stop:2824 length:459 start_codon:yes stop_codon:yes gene_type:complete